MNESQNTDYCPTCGHRVGIRMHNLEDILQRRKAGESMASIGRFYGVTRSRIHQILKDAEDEREPAA